MPDRILITGGCGYIGSRLAAVLHERGYTVRTVDKATPEQRGIVLPPGVEHVTADLRDVDAARGAFDGWP
ncbi:MAG: dTDP-L-rhamnose 4-epimerase, partial [Thermoanaerobaculia bacterium]|nr:dTDP-L-rhamnose 4-epimerase [Thermoanaerobaculia bacterium]